MKTSAATKHSRGGTAAAEGCCAFPAPPPRTPSHCAASSTSSTHQQQRNRHLRLTVRSAAAIPSAGGAAVPVQLFTAATLPAVPAAGTSMASRAFFAASLATFSAALARVSFSVLAVPIQQQFALRPSEMGLAHGALLMGYVTLQVPAGVLSDRFGGPNTLLSGMIVWSLACMAMAAVPASSTPLAVMVGARAALGLGQSVMMPGVSATAAQWFPKRVRASKTSAVYAWFNLGTVAGLGLTPMVAAAAGWPAAFLLFGGIGAVAGLVTLRSLQAAEKVAEQQALSASESESESDGEGGGGGTTTSTRGRRRKKFDAGLFRLHAADFALLCWTHGVIGFGYFVLQAWIPTLLHSLGAGSSSLTMLGMLSALPWLLTAVLATAAGRFADWLHTHAGWSLLQVRHGMHVVGNLGGCLALMPLVLLPQEALTPAIATAALCLAVATQAFNYGGFHAYVQDVAPHDAGLILGWTNTCSSLAGIVGNIAAGGLVEAAGGLSAVFALAAALQATSALTWVLHAKGKPLSFTS